MKNLYSKISDFVHETFPNAKSEHHLLKLRQEAKEAIEQPHCIYEYADCLICLLGAFSKTKFDYDELIRITELKLEINKSREWNENEDGTHQHI